MNSDDTAKLDASKPTGIAEGPPPASTPKTAMAFCPKCNGAMAVSDPVCPNCVYDFPFGGVERGPGLVFSRFADAILIIAAAITSLGCVPTIVGTVLAAATGQLGLALFLLMFALVLLALVVVFLRAQQVEPRDPGRGKRN
jgi:hypothetical protein